MKQHYFILLALIMPITCLVSCRQQGKQTDAQEAVKQATQVSERPRPYSDSIPQQPINGTIVFDISHSTRGYLDSNSSEFRGVVAKMSNILNVQEEFLYGDSAQSINADKFIETLNSGKFAWSKGSDFISMVEFMTKRVRSGNDIVCLISDGIMSGTNEQIRQDPEYNIRNREVLKTTLESKLKVLDTTYSTLIIRYTSPFKGTYYCYNNKNIFLNCNRPYYAIVIGKWSKVKWLEQDLIKGKANGKTDSFYKYTEMLMVGDNISYNKCKFACGAGVEKISKEKCQVKNKDSVEFRCSINDLPEYMQTETYINDNLCLLKQGEGRTEFSVIPKEKYNLTINNKKQKILISFGQNIGTYISHNKLRFLIKYASPNWITRYSDLDDKEIEKNKLKQDQTFNLNYFIEGFNVLNHTDYVIQTDMDFIPKK